MNEQALREDIRQRIIICEEMMCAAWSLPCAQGRTEGETYWMWKGARDALDLLADNLVKHRLLRA